MEIINAMLEDTLWIYTAIVGALIGAAFLVWFKETRAGIWGYSLFDRTLDFLVDRWGWTWLQEPEDAWRKKYPKITKKVDDLELRLKQVEMKSKTRVIRQKENENE